MKKESFEYNYPGFFNSPSKCMIHIIKKDMHYICFEELIEKNEGTSVTNISEQLATQIVNQMNLTPSEIRFFESYKYPNEPRTLDEIKYTWDGKLAKAPTWSPAPKEYFNLFDF